MMLWPLLLGVRWVPQAGKGRACFPERRGRSPDLLPSPGIQSLGHQYSLFFKFRKDVEIKGIFISKRHRDRGMSLVPVPPLCYTEQ